MIEWVRRGLLFCLFSSIIMMICPDKKYYKHLSMIMGLMFILVMIRPFSVLMHTNSQSYIDYLKHLLLFEGTTVEMKYEYREEYESVIESQIELLMKEKGFDISSVNVAINHKGEMEMILLHSANCTVEDINNMENLLKTIYGEDVIIGYE